ncbi:partial Putative HTH-type transcriptional regulator, partial [Anaerolineae bacterium]
MIRGSSRVMNAQSPLRLYLLGSFRVERDAQTLHLPSRQVESLLAYLVLFLEPHSHEKLAALFWSDSRDGLAYRSLRAALAAIRKELGDDVLVADRETVRINPGFPLWVDAREIANYELQTADSEIENYPGDLLADFDDDWILPERERLRALYEQIKQMPSENSAARNTNVPIPLTSFIGRAKEVATIQELFAKTRLLTLTGSGGCGKTRLAIQVASELANVKRFKNGVTWVEFAPLSDASLVPQAIAQSLGVSQIASQSLDETLIDYLRGKQLLLSLDNCEHLVAACAQIVDTLLRACPDLKILTTSREAMNLAGEITYRVPSLALPDL